MTKAFGLPAKDEDYGHALRLLDQDPPLDREILEALVGRPARYRDLRSLLRGRNDNVLSKALTRLRDAGLLKQGVDLDTKDHRYSLTELGILVLFRLHEMIPHQASIDAYERGVKASA